MGADAATDALAAIVDQVAYKPGWTFTLREVDRGQGCEGLTLCIGAPVVDAADVRHNTSVLHLMPVPPAAYDRDTWRRWVLDQVLLVEQHEALEFFRVAGVQVYFPEHGPGRNPYTIAEVKEYAQAHAEAVPWHGHPVTDEHFKGSRSWPE